MVQHRIVVGIDPGKKGGLVLMSTISGVQFFTFEELAAAGGFRGVDMMHGVDHAFIEKVHSMPGQGVKSMFTFGEGYGRLQGWCEGLAIPYTLVRPQDWQKEMHKGVLTVAHTAKERSAESARRLFPDYVKEFTKKSGKVHDGLVDALLIAEYGRRSLK